MAAMTETQTPIRVDIASIPLPVRMRGLPVDERGYPVPWFVKWIDGKPEFRTADAQKFVLAVMEKRCWICGDKLGRYQAFVIGPMCAINRVSSEPPSHRECALYGVQACPFLARPHMRRRENDLPEERRAPGGFFVERNPGVSLLWVTQDYHAEQADIGNEGTIFLIGDPTETAWFAEGRTATRAEVEASIESGFPTLLEVAQKQGPEFEKALYAQRDEAQAYLPKA